MKIKEIKNLDKYLDFARELKRLWNMKVEQVSDGDINRIRALGIVPKNLEIKGRIKTIQTTALLNGDMRTPTVSWIPMTPSFELVSKNSHRAVIIIIIIIIIIIQKTYHDYPDNYSKIGQNTEKSPVCLVCWFYGISTFVGYLTPNPFLCK